MPRQNIIQRLQYLRNWEFANVFLLPAVIFFLLIIQEVQAWQPYAVSTLLVCIILLQGSYYWHLKLESITQKSSLPAYFNQLFTSFKWANIGLLAIYPFIVFLAKQNIVEPFQVSFWSNFIYIFAILEHINYYYFQLSHDNANDLRYLMRHKKIRRSSLWVDLNR